MNEAIKTAAFFDELAKGEKIAILATIAGSLAQRGLLGKDPNKFMRGATAEDDALTEKILKESPAEAHQLGPLGGPHYNPDSKTVHVHKPAKLFTDTERQFHGVGQAGKYTASLPEIVAHEVGHSRIAKHKAGRFLQNKVTTLGGMVSPFVGMGAGLMAPDDISDNKVMAGSAATALPMVAYEGLASGLGYRQMKRLGASPAQLARARNRLTRAWGTYAMMPAMAAGEAKTMRVLKRHLEEGDRETQRKIRARR